MRQSQLSPKRALGYSAPTACQRIGLSAMIPFAAWLTQILSYSELVSREDDLRRAWIAHDRSKTSVTDFDEFIEQVFDDLDSDAVEKELAGRLPGAPESRRALSRFLEALRRVEKRRDVRADLQDPETLLNSAEWRAVRDAASKVLTACGHLTKSSG